MKIDLDTPCNESTLRQYAFIELYAAAFQGLISNGYDSAKGATRDYAYKSATDALRRMEGDDADYKALKAERDRIVAVFKDLETSHEMTEEEVNASDFQDGWDYLVEELREAVNSNEEGDG